MRFRASTGRALVLVMILLLAGEAAAGIGVIHGLGIKRFSEWVPESEWKTENIALTLSGEW